MTGDIVGAAVGLEVEGGSVGDTVGARSGDLDAVGVKEGDSGAVGGREGEFVGVSDGVGVEGPSVGAAVGGDGRMHSPFDDSVVHIRWGTLSGSLLTVPAR